MHFENQPKPNLKVMKKILILSNLLIFSFLYSCKNELDLTDEWSENMVVYGILNSSDSVHYVKVTKAFLGDDDNNTYAQNADSSQYHEELSVKIEEWNGTNKTRTFNLDTTTIINKESGIFYSPKQVVYTFQAKLKEGYIYKLEIKNNKTGKITNSSTVIIPKIVISQPFAFPGNPIINLKPENSLTVSYKSDEKAFLYQTILTFYYKEKVNGIITLKKIKSWDLGIKSLSNAENGYITLSTKGQFFYDYIGKNLDVPSIDIKREGSHLQIEVLNCDENYFKYYQSCNQSSSLSQDRIIYTNINDGVGVFANKTSQINNYYFKFDGVNKELTQNPSTKDLGFVPQL